MWGVVLKVIYSSNWGKYFFIKNSRNEQRAEVLTSALCNHPGKTKESITLVILL